MASGIKNVSRGSFVGTGAQLDVLICGFRPRKVRLLNITGLCIGEWQESMADASVVKQVTDGTMTVPTTNGITPLANGFRLGADADLNVAAEVVHFEATE
jgi:hypothetical protein